MTPICTTLNKIRAHVPCRYGWMKLLRGLNKTEADDEPLPLETILLINGLADTLWCLRTLPEYDAQWRLYAVWCARKVQHLTTDPRSIAAIDVAEAFASGCATKPELADAYSAALIAVSENVRRFVAWNTALAAAGQPVWNAAWYAERAAAYSARNYVQEAVFTTLCNAACAAADSAPPGKRDAALAAAQRAQKRELLRIVRGTP